MDHAEAIEKWMPIPESEYDASDLGRIRRRATGRVLAQTLKSRRQKYLSVSIWRAHSHATRNAYVHRLVLEAFVGPCPPGMEGAHGNGRHTDNRPENLRWATHRENVADAVKHGTHGRPIGSCNHVRAGRPPANRKIGIGDAIQARLMFRYLGVNKRVIGEIFGLGRSSTRKMLRGLSYRVA